MLHIYSRDRYIATIEPIAYARLPKYQSLMLHLLERLEQCGYEIGEYIAAHGCTLLQEILALHGTTFTIREVATDWSLLQNLFTKDLLELNKFEPCAEAQKPRPYLKEDPIYGRLKLKKSGDRFMDDLADLSIMLESFDDAVSLTHQLTQTQLDNFAFRFSERKRDPDRLISEQNQEYFFEEWMGEKGNQDYVNKAIFGSII